MAKYTFGLCKGRHDIPVVGYLFDQIDNPHDYRAMGAHVASLIPPDAEELVIYITGLTPAWNEVVRYCAHNRIMLTAMNYDRDTGEYLRQPILE